MKQLVLLYWGCVFLMYLSQTYYPVETQLDGPQTGKRHFMLRRADIFMIVVIAWMTCFSFLRESYNDTASYISDFMYLSDPLDRFLKNNNLLEVGSNSLFQLCWRFQIDPCAVISVCNSVNRVHQVSERGQRETAEHHR